MVRISADINDAQFRIMAVGLLGQPPAGDASAEPNIRDEHCGPKAAIERIECLLAIRGKHDFVAGFFQGGVRHHGKHGLILNEQDHRPTLPSRRHS